MLFSQLIQIICNRKRKKKHQVSIHHTPYMIDKKEKKIKFNRLVCDKIKCQNDRTVQDRERYMTRGREENG